MEKCWDPQRWAFDILIFEFLIQNGWSRHVENVPFNMNDSFDRNVPLEKNKNKQFDCIFNLLISFGENLNNDQKKCIYNLAF